MNKLVILPFLLGAGCAQTDSDDVLTSGMYADLGASSTGEGTTTVHATLYLGQPINLNFVNLTGDDQLIASFEGQDKRMSESELLNIISHHAEFQTDLEDATFEIEFRRSVDDGAPSSLVSLPAKFTIDPPPASSSRAAELTMTWAPSGTLDLMSWDARGDCIDNASGVIASDVGTVLIAPNAFKKRQNGTVDSCEVTVNITRARLGDVDNNYGKGGTATGRQVRSATFMSTP